ncbi:MULTISPECIES: SLAP domain-containing protein [Lactobacillus]|uniref:S-layer protein n=1 Tax=Lactobacillus xujianguonis TaxID=2495899 RepID=A0A437SUK0_9LACO|nr:MULTISPECIES: SLAP domain-containing protein [Lactobacillus]RVU70574.1 S-layer protein [Lactobacillus xujianguonis]RVU73801.1 S-layer protein [Lactobacillus xujianguonis]
MKLNHQILSGAAAVFAAISMGLVTSQTVQAQSITLHKGYDKTTMPYVRQKGKFISANKRIKIKKYKFNGQPILTKGDKVVYASAATPYLINQDNYYYLGHGGYLKQDNAYMMNGNTYVLTHNSYIYDKNGKRLKTFRGKRAYLIANTKIKSGVRDEYYRKPFTYYRIGKNTYVQSDQIAKVNGKGVLFISQNSAVYNSRGQRQRQVIKAGQLVPYVGKVEKKSSRYFYVTSGNNNDIRSIKNYRIKGNYYFKIGKNKYLRANNVNAINGNTLYTKGPIKGKIVTADQMVRIGMGDYTSSYYRVKAGKNPIYIDTGLYEETNPDVPYVWCIDNGPTLAKQYLESQDYYDLRYSVVYFKTNQAVFYNVNGEKVENKFAGDELAVNQKLYLWNAKDNQAELYYHVQNSLVYQAGAEDERQNTAISNLYVKASDVDISGQKLKTSNTKAEAQADSALATSSEKQGLTTAISDVDSVKASVKYRLDSWVNRSLYDQAVENAKTIASDKTATKAAVKEALWQVDFAKKNLKGAKVKVKDVNNLTPIEAEQVLNLARQAYDNDKNYLGVAVYQKWAHKAGYYPAEGWKSNQKTRYYLIPAHGGKKILLKFSDFATEK